MINLKNIGNVRNDMINNMKNSGYSRKQKEVNSQSSERKEA